MSKAAWIAIADVMPRFAATHLPLEDLVLIQYVNSQGEERTEVAGLIENQTYPGRPDVWYDQWSQEITGQVLRWMPIPKHGDGHAQNGSFIDTRSTAQVMADDMLKGLGRATTAHVPNASDDLSDRLRWARQDAESFYRGRRGREPGPEDEERIADMAAMLAAERNHYRQNVSVPSTFNQIGERIRTQDNRVTADPLFIVFQKERHYGSGYADVAWVNDDGDEADQETATLLAESRFREGDVQGRWTLTSYQDVDRFVTACFTEKGAEEYIDANGHNLKRPHIYVETLYRNREMIEVRNWLKGIGETPGHARSDAQQEKR